MIYACSLDARRELVLASPTTNGLDYIEVLGPPGRGTQLALTFLKDATGLALAPVNIRITGGAPVTVQSVTPASAQAPTAVTVDLGQTGDFSTYTLTLVAAAGSSDPPSGIDAQFAAAEFSFKAGCATPADCAPNECCPTSLPAAPDINYLAKDYGGFQQVMLDRLAVLMPAWTETHAADLGIALTEVLAYAADHLSYQQDAVSTEAYLATARSRISSRRHARLVDYRLAEGCNARTFVVVQTTATSLLVPATTTFYVGFPGLPVATTAGSEVEEMLVTGAQPVFAALADTTVRAEHNELGFYTWGDSDCCLPAGSTQATLAGQFPDLAVGDVLIFEEVRGPATGQPEDADPGRRCAIRLTGVTVGSDALASSGSHGITAIEWAAADALPFTLCISSTTDADHGSIPVPAVSVARGNVLLADHGTYISESPTACVEQLGTVAPLPPAPDPAAGCSCGSTAQSAPLRARFYPSLAQAPLTFSVPYDPTAPSASASSFLSFDPGLAVAQIEVSDNEGKPWSPVSDLLGSGPDDRSFVPEVEQDGTAFLRFGDGQYGSAPSPGMSFTAWYRTGLGVAGNIGRDTLAHVVLASGSASQITGVRNPLPGTGGIDRESMDHIRQFAPFAYQTQQRCVTEADYGTAATAFTGGLAARGTMRWTGSWYTAFVSVDPDGLDTATLADATSGLEDWRMLGTDVAVEAAKIVGLEIELEICVDPEHFQGDVYAALMEIFVSGDRCDGTPGILGAGNFSFGQTVYASPLIAAAQHVEGVASVTLTTFTRMDAPWVDGVAQGYLVMARTEIAHCDNDPNHLDHGTFTLTMDGGK